METTTVAIPGKGLKTTKMPGHWVLAQLGKRVLRPGGIQLTRQMLAALGIKRTDDVIEFAPGMGVTARQALKCSPHSYTAIERDDDAAKIVNSYLTGIEQRCVIGNASNTGLDNECATVVYGEAMLTMQTDELRRQIVREAYRLLKRGGRYGIHEMCFMRDDLDAEFRKEAERALTGVNHHGVRPLSVLEWRSLLASEGFEVQSGALAPMSLLEPGRLIQDESLVGAARFAWNLIRDSEARERVLQMRRVFRRYRNQLGAVMIVSCKN